MARRRVGARPVSETALLDTDVARFLFKKSPRGARFRPLIKGKRLAMSFVSVAELFKWTVKRQWSTERVAQLEATLRRYVVVPYDRDWAWAKVMATCEARGEPM